MKQKRKYNKIGNSLRSVVLGLSLMVAPLMGCGKSEVKTPVKPASVTQKAKSSSSLMPTSSNKEKCNVSVTSEGINDLLNELLEKCKNGESELVERGSVIEMGEKGIAMFGGRDRKGANIGFGSRDENGKVKLSLAVRIPYSSSSKMLNPEVILGGPNNQTERDDSSDVLIVICPQKNQPKRFKFVKIVKKTWNELKCIVAEKREKIDVEKQNKELKLKIKKMKRSLLAQTRKIKRNLARTTDPEKITELSKELIKVSDSLKILRRVMDSTIGMEQKPKKRVVPKIKAPKAKIDSIDKAFDEAKQFDQ
jgi:hypothetical protein